MRRTIGWRTAIVEKLQLCLDCQENPSETVGEPGFAHVERLRSEPSLQIKQTISSSFSSSCNAWKISSTTVRSSAFSLAKFFVTCWAQSSHFGVRSFSLGHNLGCTWLRHDHMSLRFYQERSVRQCLVCAHYSSIWHSMTGSAFPQSLPDPAAQQDLQRCSLRAGSWVVHQATEQGSVQWGQQGLGLQPFSASAVGEGSRGQGAFPTCEGYYASPIPNH